MVQALGFSTNDFLPQRPGRLCRGRERWIEPWPKDEGEEDEPLTRIVVSGASFSDDSAANAQRGLDHSGFDVAQVIHALFPRRDLIAFMEDGHPADIPEDAVGVEMYTGHRAGGISEELMVRWQLKVSGTREIRAAIGPRESTRVLGFVWPKAEVEPTDELGAKLYALTGMGSLDSPPSRFQPAALHDLLDDVRAVLLLHRDKHGIALGIYTYETVPVEARLEALCGKQEILCVPFAIPPMLARWDRALSELRTTWLKTRDDEFPVPVAPEPSDWRPRDRRRRGRHKDLAREARETAAAARGEE